MKGKGDALMGIGFGEGANRAVDAARQAISNPLLENASIAGAKSVLVNLSGSENLTLQEYEDVVELITQNCDENALIIAGQAFNPELGDRIKVTVVATGFEHKEEVVGSEADTISASKRFSIPTNPASAASASRRSPRTEPRRKRRSSRIPRGPSRSIDGRICRNRSAKGRKAPAAISAFLRFSVTGNTTLHPNRGRMTAHERAGQRSFSTI